MPMLLKITMYLDPTPYTKNKAVELISQSLEKHFNAKVSIIKVETYNKFKFGDI